MHAAERSDNAWPCSRARRSVVMIPTWNLARRAAGTPSAARAARYCCRSTATSPARSGTVKYGSFMRLNSRGLQFLNQRLQVVTEKRQRRSGHVGVAHHVQQGLPQLLPLPHGLALPAWVVVRDLTRNLKRLKGRIVAIEDLRRHAMRRGRLGARQAALQAAHRGGM